MKWVIFFLLLIIGYSTHAQSVYLKVVRLKSTATSGGLDNKVEHTWKVWYYNGSTYTEKKCYTLETSDDVTGYLYPDQVFYLDSYTREWVQIGLEGYENDVGKWCEFNNGDDFHHTGSDVRKYLAALAPGVWHPFTYTVGSMYTIDYEIMYTFPPPSKPIVSTIQGECETELNNGTSMCDTCPLTFSSSVDSKNLEGVTYEWQYFGPEDIVTTKTENPDYCGLSYSCYQPDPPACCSEPQYFEETTINWRTIPGATEPVYKVKYSDLISFAGSTKFTFRMIAKTSEFNRFSEGTSVDLIPPPPQFSITEISNSCIDSPTGKIDVTVTNSVEDTKEYRLYEQGKSYELIYGTISSQSFTVEGIPDGLYNLVMQYPDPACISDPQPVAIELYSPIVLDYAYTDISCHGANDGSVTLKVSGGEPGRAIIFTSDVGNENYTRISNEEVLYSNLPPGTYNFKADDNGCTPSKSVEITIKEPAAVTASVSFSPFTCASPANGSVSISNVMGGMDGEIKRYNYYLIKDNSLLDSVINTTETNYEFINLTDGTYQVQVEDANRPGCNDHFADIILTNDILTASYTTTDKTCSYSDDGRIDITASKGSGSYLYSISGPAEKQNATGIFNDLPEGSYTLTVKNNNGCEDIIQLTNVYINGPAPIIFSQPDISHVSCFEGNDGEISLHVTGGTGALTYEWKRTDGILLPGYRSETASDIRSGSYFLEVTDSRGCIGISPEYIVTEPGELLFSSNVSHITCFGEDDGYILLSSTGGTGNHTWQYEGPSGLWQHFTGTSKFKAGEYNLRIVDENGCIKESQDPVIITAPPAALSATHITSEITCHSYNDGSVTVTASGGNGAPFGNTYSYSINGGAFIQGGNTFTFKDLEPGEYSIKVKDERECLIALEPVVIKDPAPVNLTLKDKVDIECFNSATGSINVSATGGTGELSYKINDEAYTGANNFLGLPAGEYSIVARDNNNCLSNIISVVLTQPEAEINIDSLIVGSITCNNDANGSLTALVSGGNANNNLQWQSLMNNVWEDIESKVPDRIDSLAGGIYRLKVTNNAGGDCEDISGPVNLIDPDPLVFEDVQAKHVSCKSYNDAHIQVEASGGWGALEYYYSRTGIEILYPLSSDSVLQPGNYNIIVEDSLGCIIHYPSEIIITEPDIPLSLSSSVRDFNGYNISCFNASDGRIILTAEGGNGYSFEQHYAFSIDGSSFSGANEFTGLEAGEYVIAVRDNRECIVKADLVLSEPAELKLELVGQDINSCENVNSGTVEVAATGGSLPYEYSINGGAFQSSPVFNDLRAEDFTVVVKDANNCIAPISVPGILKIDLLEIRPPTCFGDCDATIEIIPRGGSAPYNIQWNDPALQQGSKAAGLCPGVYEVEIMDNNGCREYLRAEVPETSLIEFELGDPRTLCAGQEVTLDPGIEGLSYQWTSTIGFSSTEQRVTLSEQGNYFLKATNSTGCIERDTFSVYTSNEYFDVNFLSASELIAGDTLLITEVCYPIADQIEWQFAPDVVIIDPDESQPQVIFPQAGLYPVTLTAYRGECMDVITKNIRIYNPGEAPDLNGRISLGEAGIKNIRFHPNPTTGDLNIEVTMHREAPLAAFIYDNYGKELFRITRDSGIYFRLYFDISGERSGIYYVKLVSSNDMRDLKIIKPE